MPGIKISPKSLDLLKRGIELAKSDQKSRARGLFREAVYEEPRNEMAWLWLASVAATPQEAMANIEQALAINPRHLAAEEWLQRLQHKAQEPGPPEEPNSPPAAPTPPLQAVGYVDLERLREALDYLRAASELQPENQRLETMVARLEGRLQGINTGTDPIGASAPDSTSDSTTETTSRAASAASETPPEEGGTSVVTSMEEKELRGTVLVADDDPATRGLIVETLAPLGYRLLQASTGLEAMALLQQTVPDLILLSTALGQIDGYQVLRMIKNTDLTRSIPVVLLRQSGDLWSTLRSRLSPVDLTLTKPLRPTQLEQAVVRFFGKPPT